MESELLLEERLGKLLMKMGKNIAFAESCTGGLVGHRMTNVAGSSDYYLGSVTAYANETKMRILGVQEATLIAEGAVSQQTVLEMARGIREALGADIGISISGIAGPGGGSPEKPVGLVWIGVSGGEGDSGYEFNFSGDRLAVKEQAADEAIKMAIKYLEK